MMRRASQSKNSKEPVTGRVENKISGIRGMKGLIAFEQLK